MTVGGSATTDGGAGALEALEEAGIDVEMDVLCDVRTPFEDAPRVFGPQKGADAAMVRKLSERLDRLAAALRARPARRADDRLPRAASRAGSGPSTGRACTTARRFVLGALGFDERMRAAAFVVTGEGRIDEQTLQGKLVGEVATRCRQAGVPCHGVVGRIDLDPFAAAHPGLRVAERGDDAGGARGGGAPAGRVAQGVRGGVAGPLGHAIW